MTSGSPNEFLELMPNRVTVMDESARDDYGYPMAGVATRVHACLLSERFGASFSPDGAQQRASRTAYLNPYPINPDNSFDDVISPVTLSCTIVLPDGSQRRVTAIANHYDEFGNLHNQELTYD